MSFACMRKKIASRLMRRVMLIWRIRRGAREICCVRFMDILCWFAIVMLSMLGWTCDISEVA